MTHSLFAHGVIPREKLFKPAEISAVKVSPKGQVALLKNAPDGTNNLYIDDEQVTFFEEPLIHHFFWSSDYSRLVFLKDVGGSRDSHIMGVDLETSKVVDYTENFDRVLGKIYGVKGEIAAVGISGKNPLYHDVYSLNMRTGELKLEYSNERFARFYFDENLHIALKGEVFKDGSMNFITGDGKEFLSLSPEDAFHTTPLLYSNNFKS